MSNTLSEQFRAARLVGTPLFAIETPDMAATMLDILQSTHKDVPVIYHNVVEGWRGLNDPGIKAIKAVLKDGNSFKLTGNPVDCLIRAQELPEKSILMMLSFHRWFDMDSKTNAAVAQAVWNLRNTFKQNQRSLVMLGPQFRLPSELQQDVYVLESPLPSDDQLETIISEITASSKVPMLEDDDLTQAIDALRGLAAFPAEQVVSMSADKTTRKVDISALWERKRRMIEITPGLSVWREGQTFADIGGVNEAKNFFTRYINGKAPLRCIVFIDEIEKSGVANTGDLSGVNNDQLGGILSDMQDNGWTGSIFYGHPGAAKTALAKAIGNEARVPTIYLNFGAMKGSLVGQSEQRRRDAFRIIKAVGGEGALFIATCNDIRPLPPELRRRFGLPTFFFDLPTSKERPSIWQIYLGKYFDGEKGLKLPSDEDWTGAEIERCVKLAYDLNTVPIETAKYIVPIAQSAAEQIKERRSFADKKFLSASLSGIYEFSEQYFQQQLPIGGMRKIVPENN